MPPSPSDQVIPRILPGGFESFEVPRPDSVDQWRRKATQLRKALWRLLGDLPPLCTPPVTVDRKDTRDGYTLEHLSFDNGAGDTVFGYAMIPNAKIPNAASGPRPAILYHHYHGNKYAQGKEEVLIRAFARWPGGHGLITGEELVRAGYVVLCIDAYAFGERDTRGPGGENERGADAEASLFKMFAWQGRTLWGMMVRDDLLALNYLVTRPEVDPTRIAAMGMSMGATRTWWAAALDQRIKAAVSIACLTRYQDLMAGGNLRYHGIYYYVPGVLREQIDTEAIVGLIAPRPHLTLTGDQDHGSPAHGVHTINAFQRHLYNLHGQEDRFRGIVYPGVGHVYTPQMWEETLLWLDRHV